MWNPPRSGIKPVSPVLAGRLFTTEPPGKPTAWLLDMQRSLIVNCQSLSCVRTLFFATPWTITMPGSSVHRVLLVRLLEWVAISFSRGASWPRDWTWVSCIAGGFFTILAKSGFQNPSRWNSCSVVLCLHFYISISRLTSEQTQTKNPPCISFSYLKDTKIQCSVTSWLF